MVRRAFSEEFKEEAVRLVVEQGYPFSKACKVVGIGETALRRWVEQWRAKRSLGTPSPARVSADARRIKELEVRVDELEREREVLKKSTAFYGNTSRRARTCPGGALKRFTPLNARPRKALGWKTPADALDEHLRSVQQFNVATTS
jgi:transposase